MSQEIANFIEDRQMLAVSSSSAWVGKAKTLNDSMICTGSYSLHWQSQLWSSLSMCSSLGHLTFSVQSCPVSPRQLQLPGSYTAVKPPEHRSTLWWDTGMHCNLFHAWITPVGISHFPPFQKGLVLAYTSWVNNEAVKRRTYPTFFRN